jgi:type IV secretion system protein VirB3
MSLRLVPVHRVLWRSQLLLGGERELVLLVSVLAVALPMDGMNIPSAVVGALLWLLGMPALRWMAKVDPQFSQVYRRHIKYRSYYPARSRPYRRF